MSCSIRSAKRTEFTLHTGSLLRDRVTLSLIDRRPRRGGERMVLFQRHQTVPVELLAGARSQCSTDDKSVSVCPATWRTVRHRRRPILRRRRAHRRIGVFSSLRRKQHLADVFAAQPIDRENAAAFGIGFECRPRIASSQLPSGGNSAQHLQCLFNEFTFANRRFYPAQCLSLLLASRAGYWHWPHDELYPAIGLACCGSCVFCTDIVVNAA